MGYLSLALSFSDRLARWLGLTDCLSRDNSSGATPHASRRMKNYELDSCIFATPERTAVFRFVVEIFINTVVIYNVLVALLLFN